MIISINKHPSFQKRCKVFLVGYELNFYMLFGINFVFKIYSLLS
jgi:hypothetical protein